MRREGTHTESGVLVRGREALETLAPLDTREVAAVTRANLSFVCIIVIHVKINRARRARTVFVARHLYDTLMLLRCSLSSQVTVNRVIEQRVSNLHDDEARLLPPIG